MRPLAVLAALTAAAAGLHAEYTIPWQAETYVNAGSGDFAPYYMASNSGGLVTQPVTVMERARIERPLSTAGRFEYGFGLDLAAGWTKGTRYARYDDATHLWGDPSRSPANVMLQQLYGAVKYRGFFVLAGLKENDRSLFGSKLGVGDVVYSDNARPMPQIRLGFIDFQNVPGTRGWLQVQGEMLYGKFTDNDWLRRHFNYNYSFITTGVWFHYKRLYFRIADHKPFAVTFGLQHGAQFGGKYRYFRDGKVTNRVDYGPRFRDFLDVFVQKQGGSGASFGEQQYYNGNHVGSWDIVMRYRFHNGAELSADIQWLWEDGSGIGKMNGWDGVWGLRYKAPGAAWIDEAVVQYVDFTNQSGPIHYAPGDFANPLPEGEATGGDDYYNNYAYNGWTHYGMSLGTPFVKPTLYNRDGYLRFTDNRIRGFQAGVAGSGIPGLDYRMLVSYRRSWGTPMLPAPEKRHDTSFMLEAGWQFRQIPGLKLRGQFAFDSGNLYGDNYGVSLSLTYSGLIIFGRKKH